MMRRYGWLLYVLIGIACGCATMTPPAAYNELHEILSAADPADERFEVARRHLNDAKAAVDEKDQKSLTRHSELGLIEARIAKARVQQGKLIELMQQEREQKEQLLQESSTLQAKVDAEVAEQSRKALRARIEEVIEQNTLDAAAQEEIQSSMGEATEAQVTSARVQVGRELAAMALVRLAAAKSYTLVGLLVDEQLAAMRGHLTLLEKAIQAGDMAAAWEHAEKSMAQYWMCTDDAWMVAGSNYNDVLTVLQTQLYEKKFIFANEELGPAVRFSLEHEAKTHEFAAETIDLLHAAAAFLQEHPKVVLHVWISGGRHSVAIAKKQAKILVDMIEGAFEETSVSAERLSVFGLTGERPLRTLTGDRPVGTLLFMPIP